MALATIGPHRIGDVAVTVRRPRLTDGPAWRVARQAERARLRPAFGDEDSLTHWADRVLEQRTAVRAGVLVPFVIVIGDGQVVGECSFAIDERSGAAECSLWMAESVAPEVTTWTMASATLRMFELPHHVPWITGPVALGNPGPTGLMRVSGFEQVAVARQLRPYDGVPTDHVIWRLGNTPGARERLRGLAGR